MLFWVSPRMKLVAWKTLCKLRCSCILDPGVLQCVPMRLANALGQPTLRVTGWLLSKCRKPSVLISSCKCLSKDLCPRVCEPEHQENVLVAICLLL